MKDLNRIVIFIVIVGFLVALYKYQEYEASKKNKATKNKFRNRVKEEENEIEDSQTLGSLVDADSYKSVESISSNDSFFD